MNPGDIVRVPFPYVDENKLKFRPALIVSAALGPGAKLHWAMMVTNALRTPWPGDIHVPDYAAAGLVIPSKIRTAKMATIDAAQAVFLGRLAGPIWSEVTATINAALKLPEGDDNRPAG